MTTSAYFGYDIYKTYTNTNDPPYPLRASEERSNRVFIPHFIYHIESVKLIIPEEKLKQRVMKNIAHNGSVDILTLSGMRKEQ